MVNLIMFSTTEDLLKLTGLPDLNALWDAGFNMDDWDAGFCTDIKLHESKTVIDEDDDEVYEYITWIDDAYWLGARMEAYCVGFSYREFNGRHYYTVHHG